MARPLSEDKRRALLEAASELIAALGTGASTAKVAKAAGVSEGTLFTYFPTKDDLLNQLFIELETRFAETMAAPAPREATPREQLREVWNRLVDWGRTNPASRRALRQLKVSDRITVDNRKLCASLFEDARIMVKRCLVEQEDPIRAAFYIDTVLFGLAEITIDAISARPMQDSAIRQAGFDLFWNGTAV